MNRTSNTKKIASASLLTSLVAIAACMDGGGSGSNPPPGGWIDIASIDANGSTYLNASALFIATVDTNGAPVAGSLLPELKIDDCTDFAAPTPTPLIQPIFTTKDVGGIVDLDSDVPSEDIRLVRDVFGDEITYSPEDAIEEVALGKAYDITLGGGGSEVAETSWAGSLKLPAHLSFGFEEAFEIPMSGDMALTWDPTGADVIVMYLYGESGDFATCVFRDDGEFTLPAALIADLDEYGTVAVQAIIEENRVLDGRNVNLVGRSGFQQYYTLVEAPTPTPTPTGTATPTPTPAGSWSGSSTPAVATVDNGQVCDTLTVSQSGDAAAATVDLAGTHSYGAALRATLQHNGQTIDVFAAGTFAAASGPYTLSNQPVAGFTGSASGDWTLCIIDTDAYNDTGTFDSWSVHD